MNALIIVEGHNDCRTIHHAVRAPVFVLGGGYALAESMKPELEYLTTLASKGLLPRQFVVFTDPDWQGRMFRTYLDDLLPSLGSGSGPAQAPSGAGTAAAQRGAAARAGMAAPRNAGDGSDQDGAAKEGVVVRHAFLRVELGTSEVATKHHDAGNVGVEYAGPDTVRACLRRARRGFGSGRREFTLEELRTDGLVGAWDDKQQVLGSQLRRHRFCRALGIDEVSTGKALLNLLNRFFTREEYTAALQVAGAAAPMGAPSAAASERAFAEADEGLSTTKADA